VDQLRAASVGGMKVTVKWEMLRQPTLSLHWVRTHRAWPLPLKKKIVPARIPSRPYLPKSIPQPAET